MASLSDEAHRLLEALEHPAVLRHPGLHGDLVDAFKAWIHRAEGVEPAPVPDPAPASDPAPAADPGPVNPPALPDAGAPPASSEGGPA